MFKLDDLDNNKLLAGISIVMLNIGDIVLDLSENTKQLIPI